MIDTNGDGRIEFDEFLGAAKACLAEEGRGRQHTDLRAALARVRQHLITNRVRLAGAHIY
jgi:hypothetical protein